MRRQFVFIVLILLVHTVGYGQKKNLPKLPPAPSKKEVAAEEQNHNCAKTKHSTFTSRLKNYPFNLSTQIQFVSFTGGVYLINNEIVREDSLPRIKDSILYSKLIEVKTLTYPQVDKLTDILYNYGYQGKIFVITETGCYNPRNAILFLDKNSKVIEFIEICFECGKAYPSSDKISLGDICNQKLDMLHNLFKTVGIEYGITKGVVPGDLDTLPLPVSPSKTK